MSPRWRARAGATAIASASATAFTSALGACERDATPPPPPPVSAPLERAPEYVPPPPEGCVRSGSFEDVLGDATCVVERATDDPRETLRALSLVLTLDAPVVVAGTAVVARLSVENRSSEEVGVVLAATPTGFGPRPDWSRLSGVPEPKTGANDAAVPERYHFAFPVRTLDTKDKTVDGLPITATLSTPPPAKLHRVRLRPGKRLARAFSWWALRIPAPGPITRDDAGHRYVPKTVALPLPPGEYAVEVELPLHGLSPAEARVTTRVQVERPDTRRDAAAPLP